MNELTDRRREEKDRRRNEILAAAAAVATESGFDAITMDQVARRARLSRALVYLYFADKQAVHVALCERALALLQQRFAAAEREARSGREQLAVMGRAYVAFSAEEPVYFEALARFEARHSADLSAGTGQCLQLGDALHDRMAEAIRQGIADGSIRADIGNPNAISLVLWGFMHGVIQIAATKGALLAHRGTSAEEVFERALALTLGSLGNAA